MFILLARNLNFFRAADPVAYNESWDELAVADDDDVSVSDDLAMASKWHWLMINAFAANNSVDISGTSSTLVLGLASKRLQELG